MFAHKIQLVISSLFGAICFCGFVFIVRRKAKSLKTVNSTLFHPNIYIDKDEDNYKYNDNEIKEYTEELKNKIIKNFPPSFSFLHNDIYNGSAGIAYTFWKLYTKEINNQKKREEYINIAQKYLNISIKNYENDDNSTYDPTRFTCGFLFGRAGIYCLQSIFSHIQKDEDNSEIYLQKFVSELENATSEQTNNYNFMFGSSGYLSCCLFLRENIPSFPLDIIPIVFGFLITKGEVGWRKIESQKDILDREAKKRLGYIYPPKYYSIGFANWKNRKNFGLIISLLVRPLVWIYFKCSINNPSELNGMLFGSTGVIYQLLGSPELVHSSREATVLIRNSLEYHLTISIDNGFCPSGYLPIHHDGIKIQWCQGTTGFGILFARAYEVFQDTRYIEASKSAADVVWERGLVKNNFGLCHGIAGNGYLFLTLYKITKEKKYLFRAYVFANYIIQNMSKEKTKKDNYSLFNGNAGILLFLLDVLSPNKSKYPILEDIF